MSNIPAPYSHKNGRFSTLIDCVSEIRDPRLARRKKHPLSSMIIMAICGMIGGANGWTAIAQFCQDHYEWFARFLELPHGIPSHDTFSRVFSILDCQDLRWILLWLNDTAQADKVINIDGKVVESFGQGRSLIFVQAWSANNLSLFSQVRVPPNSNEIGAIPRLLDELLLRGRIVTIDAIGTQKTIAKKIVNGGAHYLLPLKKNQRTLHEEVKVFLDEVSLGTMPDINVNQYEMIEKSHGRIEHRSCWSTDSIHWLRMEHKWPKLRSISLIKTTIMKGDKTVTSQRYFISSLPANAKLILQYVRSHWSIEGQVHWPLDVVFREDSSTVKSFVGAQNIGMIRRIVISLLQKSPFKQGLAAQRARSAFSFSTLMGILLSTAF